MFVGQTVFLELRNNHALMGAFEQLICQKCYMFVMFQVNLYMYLTIILRNRAEYHLILSRRGRRPSWLNQGIFRKIEQDNCFIIQQIPIDYHFQNEKNSGSIVKTLKASNT